MYLKFYRLKEEPFHITLDPEFFYPSPSHSQALVLMARGVEQRKGLVVLTGEVGVGKTIIVHTFLEQCRQQQIQVIDIPHPSVTFSALMKMIYKELGLERLPGGAAEQIQGVYRFLVEAHAQGRNVVLVIDEAQSMSINMLEDLQRLSDLEDADVRLLQILLIGQPDLDNKLNLQELSQIRQRIGVRIRIAELTSDESLSYIRYRLTKAGMQVSETAIFTRAALQLIVKQSRGIPRKINIICDNALTAGFDLGIKPVSAKVVKDVIAGLDGKSTRESVKWVVSGACLAFLLLIITGVAIFRTMDFSKKLDGRPSPGFSAAPALPTEQELTSRGSVPIVHTESQPEAGGPSAGKPVGHIEKNKEEGGKTDIAHVEPKASLPVLSDTTSAKTNGLADHAVQKADKPVHGEESSNPAGAIVLKPGSGVAEAPPDPNKLMDWFMDKRGR